METHLNIIGYLLIVLAFVHIVFPKYFNWKEELKPLSLINRQMMQVHTFFIAVVVLMIGLLCASSANELTSTTLGKKIALGLGIFWLLRLFAQFFGYTSQVWKGKPFETTMHVVFTLFWMYLSGVFFGVYYL